MKQELGEHLGWREGLLAMVLIAVLGGLLYSVTMEAPFVLDDIFSIVNNEARRTLDFSWRGWFGTRSLPYFTLDLNYHFGQLDVTGYHAVNVVIHILAAWTALWLVYGLVKVAFARELYWLGDYQVSNHVLLAVFAGLLFVSHPMQTQAVTYIVQRIASIAVMFYLLALLGYVLYRSAGYRWRWVWAVLSLAATILAMHSKEIAVTIPVAILLIEWFFFSTSLRALVRRIPKLLPWLLTVLIIPFYLTGILDEGNLKWLKQVVSGEAQVVLELDDSIEELEPGQVSQGNQVKLSHIAQFAKPVSVETEKIARGNYLVTQFRVVARYIRLLVVPVGQNIDHDIELAENLFAWRTVVSLIFLLGVLGSGVWLFIKRRRLAAFGIFFFFIGLSVESSIVPITDVIFEHRAYVGFIGFALVLADGLQWLFGWAERKKLLGGRGAVAVIWLAALLIVVLSIGTWQRNLVWRDALSLWGDAVAKSPRKARPLNNLGLAYMAENEPGKAEETFQQALKSEPDNHEVLINLGSLYGQLGRYQASIEVLEKAIAVRPDAVSAYVNLGNTYLSQLEFERAEEKYRQALTMSSAMRGSATLASLGDALIGQDRRLEAMEVYERTVALDDTQAPWFNRLGALYAMEGRLDEAAEALGRALDLDPDLPEARQNLQRLKKEYDNAE